MTRWVRRGVKIPLLLYRLARRMAGPPRPLSETVFWIYHSVSGRLGLELDLDTGLFARHLAELARCAPIIAYDQALAELSTAATDNGGICTRRFVLTFDDGYESFYTQVFPLLRHRHLPAILFVNTGFVEDGCPYALDRPHPAAKPVTWEMLGTLAESGLVTLGAHTHTHRVLAGAPPDQVVEELELPLEIFERRLGLRPQHFAYPRARWDLQAEALVAQRYASAVIGAGGCASPATFHPYRIPRLPVRRSDGWWFFRAKSRGWLDDEEALYAWARRLLAATARRVG